MTELLAASYLENATFIVLPVLDYCHLLIDYLVSNRINDQVAMIYFYFMTTNHKKPCERYFRFVVTERRSIALKKYN